MNFQDADQELRGVGEAVQAFLTQISEAAPEDVSAVLVALERWRPPMELTAVDLATLMGTMEALRLRLQHGAGGEVAKPELLMLDTASARCH